MFMDWKIHYSRNKENCCEKREVKKLENVNMILTVWQ